MTAMASLSWCVQVIGSLLPAVAVCVVVSMIIVRRVAARKALQLPPGPVGLPIIGHLHLMGQNPHQTLHKLSQRYGPLFFMRFGSVPVIVASSPQTARLILQTHDQIFAGRFPTTVDLHLNGRRSIVLSQPGPYHTFVRQLCNTHLFSAKMLHHFSPISNQELTHLLCSILAHSHTSPLIPFQVRPFLYSTFANIVSRMMLGNKLASQFNFVDLVLDWVHLMSTFDLSDYIPCSRWLDLQGYAKQSKLLRSKINTVFKKAIDERRQEHAQGSDRPHGFLNALLSSASLDGHRANIQLTHDHIITILMNLFAGGIDTSALAIEWALMELLANPEKLSVMKDELCNVVGTTRLVQQTDICHLPYLQAVVKETLRLHPVAPLLIPHYSSQPCQLLNFDIPSNTVAFVNVWAIGRDPILWENASSFVPERFLGSNMDVYGRHFELLPFGCGRRVCPGLLLGLHSVQLVLANLLHCFDWEKVGELEFSEKYEIVLQPTKPLTTIAKAKLPIHVIEAIASFK